MSPFSLLPGNPRKERGRKGKRREKPGRHSARLVDLPCSIMTKGKKKKKRGGNRPLNAVPPGMIPDRSVAGEGEEREGVNERPFPPPAAARQTGEKKKKENRDTF